MINTIIVMIAHIPPQLILNSSLSQALLGFRKVPHAGIEPTPYIKAVRDAAKRITAFSEMSTPMLAQQRTDPA
jgi:hypothetical protein